MMKKLFLILPALMLSVAMLADVKSQRVLVIGDDPMMVSDESIGSVGYATALQSLFVDAVKVDVKASSLILSSDPTALLRPATKGDIVLLYKKPVETALEERLMSDVYLEQLTAIAQVAKKKGVKLVWLTPACPRYYTYDSVQVRRLGNIPDVVRHLCQRDALPIIDVEMLMFDWLTAAGLDSTAAAFVPVVPETPAATEKVAREGNALTEQGAQQVAALIGDAIRADKKHLLYRYLKP